MTILNYLRQCRYVKTEKFEWKYLLFLVFIYFVLTMPLGAIGGLVSKAIGITRVLSNKEIDSNFWKVVILAPIIEESLFRFLLKPRLKNLIVFSLISFIIISYLLWKQKYGITCAWGGIQVVAMLLIWKKNSYLRKFYRIYLQKFSYLFYFSIIMFGLVHLGNFTYPEITIWIVLLSPLLILPQLIMGSMLGFIRMKWGIVYSILFHTMVNGIAFSIMNLN